VSVTLICYLWFPHSSVAAAAADSKSPKDEKGELSVCVQIIMSLPWFMFHWGIFTASSLSLD